MYRSDIVRDVPVVSDVSHQNVLKAAHHAAPETHHQSICIPLRGPSSSSSKIPAMAKANDAGRPIR